MIVSKNYVMIVIEDLKVSNMLKLVVGMVSLLGCNVWVKLGLNCLILD